MFNLFLFLSLASSSFPIPLLLSLFFWFFSSFFFLQKSCFGVLWTLNPSVGSFCGGVRLSCYDRLKKRKVNRERKRREGSIKRIDIILLSTGAPVAPVTLNCCYLKHRLLLSTFKETDTKRVFFSSTTALGLVTLFFCLFCFGKVCNSWLLT